MGRSIVGGFLPVGVGAVLGALVVTLLLSGESADDPSAAATTALQRTAPYTAGALVESDRGGPDTAVTLGELSSIADPSARREAALALLDVYGHDAAGIDRVAASLPPIEGVNFRIAAIVNLAASDMEGAFAAAMALPDQEQRRLTLLRLAPALAETDPLAAIAAVEEIDAPALETEFVAALLEAWAVLDPEQLLAMADDFRRDLATLATTAAFEALIERDPEAALARIDALPPGADRSGLERAAAEMYGEQHPEAAWEWAAGSDIDALARIAVVRGIHQVDPDRAWEIMLSQLNNTDDRLRADARERLMNYVYAVANSASPDDIVIGLDRLLSLNDPFVVAQMQTNVQAWANRDPEAALDWSLSNLDRFDSTRLLTNLSAGLARTNVDLARETVFRLDEEYRTSWAAGVGRTLAEYDLVAARSWAYELPSGPLRDAGLHEVIRGEAQGGSVDRQLFDQFSSDRARGEAASSAARRFACDGRTDLAREIATAYITDQRLLEQTEQGIQENSDAGSFSSSFLCRSTP